LTVIRGTAPDVVIDLDFVDGGFDDTSAEEGKSGFTNAG